MKSLGILLLLLLGLQLYAQNVPAKLALSWIAGHCEYLSNNGRSCDDSVISKWDKKSFTIHGFWPSLTGSPFGQFDLSTIKNIESQLLNSWPPRSQPFKDPKYQIFSQKYFLWIHEWNKHGQDFVKSFEVVTKQVLQNIPVTQKKLQLQYFTDVLKMFKSIRTKLVSNPKTKTELSKLLGIPQNSFVTRCLPSGNLQEIQICYEIFKQGSDLGYKIVKCLKNNSNCKGNTVHLQGYK